jgi:hypothetical protein
MALLTPPPLPEDTVGPVNISAQLQDYRERAMARAAAAGRSAAVLARTTRAAAVASWRSDTGED